MFHALDHVFVMGCGLGWPMGRQTERRRRCGRGAAIRVSAPYSQHQSTYSQHAVNIQSTYSQHNDKTITVLYKALISRV